MRVASDFDKVLPKLSGVCEAYGVAEFDCPTGRGHKSTYYPSTQEISCSDGECPEHELRNSLLMLNSDTPPRCDKSGQYMHDHRYCPSCLFWDRVQAAQQAERADAFLRELREQHLIQATRDGTVLSEALDRFPLHSAQEVSEREVVLDSLPGILGPPGTLTEVTGYRGSGKSLAIHGLAQAVAHGHKRMWGRPLRLHGPVLYVAREGRDGWTRRIKAWEAYHGEPAGEGVQFMHQSIDITRGDDLAALTTIVKHKAATVVVLDPVAMTGGGKEDEETYIAYRTSALALALATNTVVVLLTNTGHSVRTRGRNSSMLVDGVDVSLALVKDEKTGLVPVKSNKTRDTEDVDDLVLQFEGCGDTDPETGRFLSGVMVERDREEQLALAAEQEEKALEKARAVANAALTDRCACSVGALGTTTYPQGCPKGGATGDDMAEAAGIPRDDRDRSKRLSEIMQPLIRQGQVRKIGHTRGQRWHWGAEPKHRPESDA